MNTPPLTYHCNECDVESPEWEDEPLGLCLYTGRPHGAFGSAPGPCDCGATTDWTCDDCLEELFPPQWTALDESYARAETMRRSDYL